MKVHIQTYLTNLEENLLSHEDKTQLYLLFVNCFQVSVKHVFLAVVILVLVVLCVSILLLSFYCFQDSLMCSEARETESKAQQRQADIRFLSRFARKQTPDRQEDHAEFLLDLAKLRICLNSAALQLEKAADQGV